MNLQIQLTEDGSHTLFWADKNEHYHSTHGSVQEAVKVYLETALQPAVEAALKEGRREVEVFEMGFGTGLNALLTCLWAEKNALPRGVCIHYTAVEQNPLPEDIWRSLNYARVLNLPDGGVFSRLHETAYDGRRRGAGAGFTLTKLAGRLQDTPLPDGTYHAIYYDAFAPQIQPELWTPDIFKKLRRAAARPCFLSTYCAQGAFKRALREAGFEVHNFPGPPGKREITRGTVGSDNRTPNA